MSEFGERFKTITDKYCGNPANFSKIVGFKRGYTSKVINGGNKSPGVDIIKKVANKIQITSDDLYWLITGKTPEPPQKIDSNKAPEHTKELENCKKEIDKLNQDIRWYRSLIENLSSNTLSQEENHQGHDIGLRRKKKPVSTAPK